MLGGVGRAGEKPALTRLAGFHDKLLVRLMSLVYQGLAVDDVVQLPCDRAHLPPRSIDKFPCIIRYSIEFNRFTVTARCDLRCVHVIPLGHHWLYFL